VRGENGLTRRAVLLGAAGAAAGGLGGAVAACGGDSRGPLWKTALRQGIVFGAAWSTRLAADGLWCMNQGNANKIKTLRFST
jgi:hypothetical protein